MKARAFCLSVRGAISGAIHKALACRSRRDLADTFRVFNPKPGTVVIAEIEFRKIAMHMLLADMMERTNHAALENGKIVFGAIDVNEAAEARIFFCRMVHGSMARKFFSEFRVGGISVAK